MSLEAPLEGEGRKEEGKLCGEYTNEEIKNLMIPLFKN